MAPASCSAARSDRALIAFRVAPRVAGVSELESAVRDFHATIDAAIDAVPAVA